MDERRRAKILCTLGPATREPEMLDRLIEAGMNAVRINFSHGSHEDHGTTYERVRDASSVRGTSVAILADLQGPKIRVGQIPDPGIELRKGEAFTLTTDAGAEITATRVPVDYEPLAREVSVGDPILMDDGALEAKVTGIEGTDIVTEIINGGVLKSRKGVNLPGTELSLPSLTDKDRKDLRFALDLGVDTVALSFVRTVDDLKAAHEIMDEVGRRVPLIAKIEKPEAIDNLDAIIEYADGLMVARGDLGVEMGPEEVPVLQKQAIERCNARGKLLITATQMLDSMIRNPRPTRAEAGTPTPAAPAPHAGSSRSLGSAN